MNKRSLLIFIGLFSILSGCASIKSVPFNASDTSQSGIPYNLPRSVVKVALKINRNDPNAGLTLTSSSEIVPDHAAVFYARPDLSIWTDSDHHIILQNGLLNSIDTIDDGRVGEVLNNVAQTAVNLDKISAGRSESAVGESPFTTAEPFPTREEIRAILALIDGGQFSFNPVAGGKPKPIWNNVPGTAGILLVQSKLTTALPASAISVPASGLTYQTGVFTRTLRASTVETEVAIDMRKLYERRIAVTDNEHKESERKKRVIESRIKQHRKRRATACKENVRKRTELNEQLDSISQIGILDNAEQYADRKSFLEEKLAKIAIQDKKCADFRKELQERDDRREDLDQTRMELGILLSNLRKTISTSVKPKNFVLSGRNDTLMVVDTSKNLRVPISRAWIGKTTNNLRFEDGIFKDFHQTKPAELLVATEATVKTTQTLFDGLLEVLRIPQVILGIEKEEKIAEIELTEQEIRLLGQRHRVAAIETEIEVIEAQVQLILQQTNLEQVRQSPQDHMDQLATEDTSDDDVVDPADDEGMEEDETDSPEEALPDQESEDNNDQAEGTRTGEDTALVPPSSDATEETLTIGQIADDGEQAMTQKLQSLREKLALLAQSVDLALETEGQE